MPAECSSAARISAPCSASGSPPARPARGRPVGGRRLGASGSNGSSSESGATPSAARRHLAALSRASGDSDRPRPAPGTPAQVASMRWNGSNAWIAPRARPGPVSITSKRTRSPVGTPSAPPAAQRVLHRVGDQVGRIWRVRSGSATTAPPRQVLSGQLQPLAAAIGCASSAASAPAGRARACTVRRSSPVRVSESTCVEHETRSRAASSAAFSCSREGACRAGAGAAASTCTPPDRPLRTSCDTGGEQVGLASWPALGAGEPAPARSGTRVRWP